MGLPVPAGGGGAGEGNPAGVKRGKPPQRHVSPGALMPMCCWPSMTKPPIGCPSGL